MAVAPLDPDRVVAHCFHIKHLERGFKHREWRGRGGVIAFLRLRTVRTGAAGARTLVTQVGERIFTEMAVFPVDLYAFGFGDRDVFRFGYRFNHWVRSTSRTPEIRRMAL